MKRSTALLLGLILFFLVLFVGGYALVSKPQDSSEWMVELICSSLADQLDIQVDKVAFLGMEAVDWRDSCFEVNFPGTHCAPGLIPGYRISIEAGGKPFEYRVNQNGTLILRVPDQDEDGP